MNASIHRFKKLTAFVLAFLICLGSLFVYAGEVFSAKASGSLTAANMSTSDTLYIYYNANQNLRWNINNAGIAIGDCVHLDDKDGKNCTMKLYSEKIDGVQYYAIKYTDSGYYIDTEGNNDKTGEVLHQYKKSISQDNQRFRFVPVAGKENVYYILSKKGDNSNKELYVGLQGAAATDTKLVTTDTPTEWYITSYDFLNMAPLKGGEKKFGQDNLMAAFTPEGYLCDINIQDELVAVDGSDLHLYYIGTSSKFMLKWNEEYQGYTIYEKELDESNANALHLVWDVEGQKKDNGTQIHMWSVKTQHPTQVWRFIPQGDNIYQIYNAYTGKYLSLKEKKDENGVKVVQDETAMNWEVNLLDWATQDTESANWMKNLDDNLLLSEVNMPGTHDTGAMKMRGEDGIATQDSVVQCQQLYPDEQLNMGIRAFDIRCDSTDDDGSDGSPDIVHGDSLFQCQNRDGSSMRLSDIMDTAKTFLANHPTECLIMSIKADVWLGAGDDGNVARAVASYVQDKNYPLWRENRIPTVGEARGKVILLRRYELGNFEIPDGMEEWELGFDLSDWDSFDYSKFANALKIFSLTVDDGDGDASTVLKHNVYVQDYYKADNEQTKITWFYGTISNETLRRTQRDASNNPSKEKEYGYLFNYTTTADKLDSARDTNLSVMQDEQGIIKPGYAVGIAMLNYVDCKTAKKIWRTNFGEATVTVQQTLSSEQHGITVSGKVQAGAMLRLVRLEDTDSGYQALKNSLGSGKLLRGWHIALVNEDGTDAAWDGELTVSIKKEALEKLKKLSVCHLDNAGAFRMLQAVSGDDDLTFSVDKLGYFGVVQKDDDSPLSGVPTGDTANILPALSLLLLSGAVFTLGLVGKKRLKKD